jgi:hypothetical protein
VVGIIVVDETVDFEDRNRWHARRRDWMNRVSNGHKIIQDNHSPAAGGSTITWRCSSTGSPKTPFNRFTADDRRRSFSSSGRKRFSSASRSSPTGRLTLKTLRASAGTWSKKGFFSSLIAFLRALMFLVPWISIVKM